MTWIIDKPGRYTLTHDFHDNIRIVVPGVVLDGNGFTVRGDKSVVNSIGIQSIAANTTVTDVNVTGWGSGIHLGGSGSKVTFSNAYDCMTRGIGVAGGNGVIDRCTAGYIGDVSVEDYNGVTIGIGFWGGNNVVSNSNVHHILGAKESVGYMLSGSGKLQNSLAQGQDSTGWSFGVWGGGTDRITRQPNVDLQISNSYLHSWDDAIGNKGGITVTNSTLKAYHAASYAPADYGANVVATQMAPDNAKYIRGTADRDHIVGGSADSLIVGMGGGDTIYGGAGKDIFACSPSGALTCLPDFTPDVDRISTNYYYRNGAEVVQNGDEATGSLATFLFDFDTKVKVKDKILYFDRDGGGPAPQQQIAYLPYMDRPMQHSDFYWV
jgi:hypothetical protein